MMEERLKTLAALLVCASLFAAGPVYAMDGYMGFTVESLQSEDPDGC